MEEKKDKDRNVIDNSFIDKVPDELKEQFRKFLDQKEQKVPVQVRLKKSTKDRWETFVKKNKKNIPTMAQLIREAVEYYISLDGSKHPFADILQKSWLLRRIVINLMERLKMIKVLKLLV